MTDGQEEELFILIGWMLVVHIICFFFPTIYTAWGTIETLWADILLSAATMRRELHRVLQKCSDFYIADLILGLNILYFTEADACYIQFLVLQITRKWRRKKTKKKLLEIGWNWKCCHFHTSYIPVYKSVTETWSRSPYSTPVSLSRNSLATEAHHSPSVWEMMMLVSLRRFSVVFLLSGFA